jgi:iron(III) transport system permease protein
VRRSTAWALSAFILVFFAVAFLWPLARVVVGGVYVDQTFTLRYLIEVFRNPIYLEGLGNSFRIAAGTTLLATLLAVPLAWINNRFTFPGKRAFSALILVPMILPPFVGAIGFQQILGQYGALNAALGLGAVDWLGQGRLAGVILLQALSLYPVLYLNVAAALANLDHAMDEAAENLGGHGITKFRRITLPLILPGLFAGGTIVFIWSFTELGTPLIMNVTKCASVQVFDGLKDIGANPFPYALILVLLTASVLIYLVGKVLLGGRSYAMAGKAATNFAETPLRGGRGLLAALPFAVVVGLALLPHLGVALTAFSPPGGWYRTVLPEAWTMANLEEALGHGMTVGSIRNSLLYSGLAVMVNILLGLAIAYVVARSDLPVRGLIDALSMLPLAVPGLVMAFGYLSLSSLLANLPAVKESPALRGLFDIQTNPTLFLVVAYSVRRLPYLVRSAVAGLQQTSVSLEEAAANLGAPPLTTVRRITVPLILANLIAGALLAFAFSMLEVSDSLMLAQRMDHYPITKTIYELFQLIGTGKTVAAALGLWAMLFLAVTIAGSSLLLGKKMGALFRA